MKDMNDMTADEKRELFDRIGLPMGMACRLAGSTYWTGWRWIQGERGLTRSSFILLQLMADGKIKPSVLARYTGVSKDELKRARRRWERRHAREMEES